VYIPTLKLRVHNILMHTRFRIDYIHIREAEYWFIAASVIPVEKEDETPQVPKQKTVRLHYLDWLRVLAILGVIIFHAVHPFDHISWHIKDSAPSVPVTLLTVSLYPWGMPLFFLISGAAS
ncbi:MAG: acyltransferase family protein, partial [Candidatus Bathyarchaeota archaeon]|nr:acyltransferase family protein [Candidatus Bathyarchaeota archaeon]